MHTRNTIVMAVVFLLLGGFVYFYEIRGREAREEQERQAELLLRFDPEQVETVKLTASGATVVARKSDGRWQIVEPAQVAADGEALDTIVEELAKATHERVVAEAPEDLAPFGLADPAVKADLTLADGAMLSVAVGKDTPVGFNLYASTGDGKVYSAGRTLRGHLDKGLFDLRDKAVLDFEEADVERVEIHGADYHASVSLDREAGEAGEWSLTEPIQERADDETLEDLLAELHTGETAEFVLDATPDADQLAEYGLDSPALSITLWTSSDASQRLLVGKEAADPEGRYAMREGGSSVFVVPASLLEELPSRLDDLRNHQLLTVARDRVQAVEIGEATRAVRLEREGTGWAIVRPRALAADASAVSRFLTSLLDLRAEGFGDERGPRERLAALDVGPAVEGGDSRQIEIFAVGPPRGLESSEEEPVRVRPVITGESSAVYLVDVDDLADVTPDAYELRDKTLVEFTQPELTGIDVTAAGGSRYTFAKQGDSWQRTDASGEAGEAVDDLLWDLNYLRMEGVATEWDGAAPDLTAYGLAVPRYRVVARVGDEVVADVAVGNELPLGTSDTGGRVYVLVAGHAGVYEVAASLADALDSLTGGP